MLVCAFFAQLCTRDRGCSVHPAFPLRETTCKPRAPPAARMRTCVCCLTFEIEFRPRHCEPTGHANARPMTGSAKQSIVRLVLKLDCFVAALLAMTADG